MSGTIQIPKYEASRNYVDSQACVIAVRKSQLPAIVKQEAEQFIERNVLPDCGRIPPNCFKAFLVKTLKSIGMPEIVPKIKSLFKASIGYQGYYLNAGNLYRVD